MKLENRTVLLTGAGRGIGRELTRQLIAAGAEVIAVGRDRDHLAALVADHGNRVHPWPVDLTDAGAVDVLVSEVTVRHPNLSAVINNAGVQTLTDLLHDDAQTLSQTLRREIAVNLDAVIALSIGLLPHLRQQHSAAIVNVTSGLALAPKRSAPVYCATKAAVRTFTRGLRYQCRTAAPTVRVTDAVMALVDTDMTRGRGRGKISARAAASEVIDGMRRGRDEIYIGNVKVLRALMRISPALGYRILRDG
ncbi:SDR family NAD(P)-dependent oxidoreductase [Micromonospora sp. KC213]|uniref:SDR family oxidoreductase n=1 Tax=Micromonospora sp. KC213 TaxID=2530378 RepID=UPI0014055702|nr:SDR family NAD(P)-dependent oxidoreductase [Micromonospora sp. KC213]